VNRESIKHYDQVLNRLKSGRTHDWQIFKDCTIENCLVLQNALDDMIQAGMVSFNKTGYFFGPSKIFLVKYSIDPIGELRYVAFRSMASGGVKVDQLS